MTSFERITPRNSLTLAADQPIGTDNSLDIVFFDGHEHLPIRPHAPPEPAFARWLSVDQIRKMQRMRKETVIAAMESGELPHERRGRIRYARLSDVLLWEEKRLTQPSAPSKRSVDPDLADLAG
ncbi:MAG: helix-turn-helix domain-containing protein [Planctomycetes bacterium]|nr:helix-turn-helix domain-containing protein [Planctomycetota bacterium]MBI3833378.1 helix-turn-helix domain-containing protein [Planctomycetota bacterium]